MLNWRKALGAAAILCALAAISNNAARADGGPAQYRWVDSCNSTFGPTDAASSSTVTVDKRGNLCTVVASGGGGVGGAATLAAGAVAAGAYVAGSVLDGAVVTIGALADAAWTSGNGSVIAILKNIATAAATTNTNFGALADAACATDNGTCSFIALLKRNNQNATTLNTTASNPANIAAAATGGCTPGVILSAASNNSALIGAAGARTLCELTWLQTTTTLMDIRLYDVGSAPTCSSATGVVANYVVQSNATSPGATVHLGPFGKAFTSGIGICITGANANNDNTNAATGLNVNYSYK